MSMLSRYKKHGGFEQLLFLIESSNDKKQEQFLKLIEAESSATALMLKSKMLTVERVFSWEESFLGDIVSHVPVLVLSILLKNKSEEIVQRVLGTLSHGQKQEVLEKVKEANPSLGEYETARIRLIQTVRELNDSGKIQIRQIAPDLDILNLKVS